VIVLGTFGGKSSQATGVNDNGEVVGFASESNGYQHAFTRVVDQMVDLGTLGGGSSYAYGVNDSGEVVGYSWLADGDQQAFLYTGGTMLDLNSLIPTNSGWELLTAYGINDSGQITGEGLYNGQLSAFLLMNPTRFIFHAPIHTVKTKCEMWETRFRRNAGNLRSRIERKNIAAPRRRLGSAVSLWFELDTSGLGQWPS